MNKLIGLGRWLFVLPFSMYVLLHFGKADVGASFVPVWLPFPVFWNYATGVCVLLFIISCVWGRYDKLASLLMALYVFLMIILVHVPRAATSENDLLNVFRNTIVVGGLLMYAGAYAKDRRLAFSRPKAAAIQ
ncbi:DoxX family protein [Spirosoma sordidisoli]|uniref:DoxX family protein n=1 Tax=Spirosoma sordidisoli TaxID=2502893 RepID=A0A4Q2UN67_9BACT|nr:hypothetical protein [Spirosoma sordidisoli]RYC71093.1 hypothetical protein EQG79_02800 [Spirosoma sordidisoli]